MLWVKFAICFFLIIVSGYKLSSYADIISKAGRFSASLMGILILAFITSCPELVVSLTSITTVNAPDLAMGDLLGADVFNIFAIALLGIICGRGSILMTSTGPSGQSRSNILSAALTAVMLFVVIGFIILSHIFSFRLEIFNISLGSILLAVIYILGCTFIYKHEAHIAKPETKEKIAKPLIIKFIISALIIIGSGIWLAYIGKEITDFYNWNEMYVGVLLLAFATTTPEFIVSLTALKRNSVYMATGNLLGSNLFNLFIIFVLDASLRKGNFFSCISGLNILPASLAIILTVIAIGAMLKKPARKPGAKYFPWDSTIIITVFLAGHYLLFKLVHVLKW